MAPDSPSLVPGYKPYIYQLPQDIKAFTKDYWERQCAVHGGFNRYTQTFTPFVSAKAMGLSDYLDAITAAIEAGIVHSSPDFVLQLFATTEVFEEFLAELRNYSKHHMVDRWYQALRNLVNCQDEQGFVTCTEIADVIGRTVKGVQYCDS